MRRYLMVELQDAKIQTEGRWRRIKTLTPKLLSSSFEVSPKNETRRFFNYSSLKDSAERYGLNTREP